MRRLGPLEALEAPNTIEQRPFGDCVGARRQTSRLPVLVEEVRVGEVLDLATGRIAKIPEICRRHLVATGTYDRLPAVLGKMQTAAEYLVNIAYLESDVLELRPSVACRQQRDVVMIAFLGAAAEQAGVRVTIRWGDRSPRP
jgi:hypothetical protein